MKQDYILLDSWDKTSQYLEKHNFPVSLLNGVSMVHDELDMDAFSKGQLCSKIWLSETFKEIPEIVSNVKHVVLCGGWYGTLAPWLFQAIPTIEHITSVDIDPKCERIAKQYINKSNYQCNKFNAITEDMFDLDYSPYDVVVNTSFEHIDPEIWYTKMRDYKIPMAIQSNNFHNVRDHINVVDSLAELEKQLKFNKIFYKGVLEIPIYKRFMVIGSY